MKHVRAPLSGFETVPIIEDALARTNPDYRPRPPRRFPVRFLRYWFMRHALESLHRRLGRPLNVLEVGIGHGNMLAFMGGPALDAQTYALPAMIARWDAVSGGADPATLSRYSYSSFQQADLDQPFELANSDYDAIIALHVLEHLKTPEQTMSWLLPAMRRDGVLMGGSPTMPNPLGRVHELYLRRKFADKMHDIRIHKHLSVISPGRMRRFARSNGLHVDLLSGAFLVRASRSPLENKPWWIRMNLAWGALFPALGGEVYFALRKS